MHFDADGLGSCRRRTVRWLGPLDHPCRCRCRESPRAPFARPGGHPPLPFAGRCQPGGL